MILFLEIISDPGINLCSAKGLPECYAEYFSDTLFVKPIKVSKHTELLISVK